MFYPAGEYLRFVRIPENVPVGGEVLQVEVHPRRNLSLRPVDKVGRSKPDSRPHSRPSPGNSPRPPRPSRPAVAVNDRPLPSSAWLRLAWCSRCSLRAPAGPAGR